MVMGLLPMQAVAEEGQECANCSHIHWGDAVCGNCGLCSADCPSGGDCWYETHCKNCGSCYMSADNWCDECGWCDDCAAIEGLHCESCGECFENGADRCPIHEDEPHCAECAGFVCEECQHCEYVDDISECSECGLCTECCQGKSLDEGCSTGEVCIESLEWSTHICEDCGACFCETDKCDTCN